MACHSVVFPRFQEDVASKKRTLYHEPLGETGGLEVGDRLILTPHENFPRGVATVVTAIDRVRLKELPEADLEKLAVGSREEYLSRWDAAFPHESSSEDPQVWRIEFRYLRPDEP
jgi:hypothetical protein